MWSKFQSRKRCKLFEVKKRTGSPTFQWVTDTNVNMASIDFYRWFIVSNNGDWWRLAAVLQEDLPLSPWSSLHSPQQPVNELLVFVFPSMSLSSFPALSLRLILVFCLVLIPTPTWLGLFSHFSKGLRANIFLLQEFPTLLEPFNMSSFQFSSLLKGITH